MSALSNLPGVLERPSWRTGWAYAAGTACCVLATYQAFSTASSGDYARNGAVSGDNAGPALAALAHGQLGVYAAHQPLMGLGSLLLRLPVVAAASAAGAGDMTIYRLGALACLLPCALIVAWMIARRTPSLATVAHAVLLVWILLLSPLSRDALRSGHPEELLAAMLAAGATLAAMRGRGTLAGLLVGIAMGTKPWTCVALVSVLASLPRQRPRILLPAAGTALLLAVPPVLANPGAFSAASHALGGGHLANAISGWWQLGEHPPTLQTGPRLVDVLPFGFDKSAALLVALLGGVGAALLACAAAARRARHVNPLILLALVGLARCVGDPGPVLYYLVALVVPLAMWEFAERERAPLAAAGAAAAFALLFDRGVRLPPSELSAISLACTTAIGAYLAYWAPRSSGVSGGPIT